MQLPHSLVLCALVVGVAASAEDIRPQQPDAGEPGVDGGGDSHVTHHDNEIGPQTRPEPRPVCE